MEQTVIRANAVRAVSILVIALGSTMATVYSAQSQYLWVYGGLLLFAVGYQLMEWVETGRSLSNPLKSLSRVSWRSAVVLVVFLGVGLAAMTGSLVLFSQALSGSGGAVFSVVAAGLLGFGGYMLAHTGVKHQVI